MYKEKTFFEYFDTYQKKYEAYENKSLDELQKEIMSYAQNMSQEDQALILSAFNLGENAHRGQTRKTGQPYFTHPVTIVCMMLQYSPDAILIAATLLHDTVEDTTVTVAEISRLSPEVSIIVEGATKIGGKQIREMPSVLTSEHEKFETIRKILTASQKDMRILFLKIFDRLHNMITISGKKPESQRRIALETLYIYVPLAKRCGLREVYHLSRALCMTVLEPEKWSTLQTFMAHKSTNMRQEMKEVIDYFTDQKWSQKIIDYRIKFFSPFSVHDDNYFSDSEWYALQIIVEKPTNCYVIMHDIGHRADVNCIQIGPIIDFINNPRFSGYSGLHFETIFRGYKRVKIRILPQEAQDGILRYRTFEELEKIYSQIIFRDFDLINEATLSNSEAFMESVTAHVFSRKIPIHSIKDSLFYMPIGLTVLDTVIYLEPEKFRFIQTIYRNNEKVPGHAVINSHDIITYTFGNTVSITAESKKDMNSGISHWRMKQKK